MRESPLLWNLLRKNRLHTSLMCILMDWTPDNVVKGWPLKSLNFVPRVGGEEFSKHALTNSEAPG
jgi:hypothetical protein